MLAANEAKQPLYVLCGACKHVWVAAYTPMEITRIAKVLKGIHCPACGAPSENICIDVEAAPS